MLRSFLLLIASALTVQAALAQDEPAWERRTQVSLELGYFSPSKETFRNNYDQRLVFGSASFPLAVGIEVDRPLYQDLDFTLNIRRINHRLKSSDDFSLALMPATLGIRYLPLGGGPGRPSWNPFFGAGVEFCWARFGATYIVTEQTPDPIAIASESQNYFGYGFNISLGVDHPLGDLLSWSIGAGYDINHLGSSTDGGLGNVGGFLFSTKLCFNF